jgi:hypothetical protein
VVNEHRQPVGVLTRKDVIDAVTRNGPVFEADRARSQLEQTPSAEFLGTTVSMDDIAEGGGATPPQSPAAGKAGT